MTTPTPGRVPTRRQYAERDVVALDDAGGYYFRHVSAMTTEGLHAKSDIAAELAWRDAEIDRLTAALSRRSSGDEGREFVEAGFAYLNAISDGSICSDRSCIRCRIADVLFEVESGLSTHSHAPVDTISDKEYNKRYLADFAEDVDFSKVPAPVDMGWEKVLAESTLKHAHRLFGIRQDVRAEDAEAFLETVSMAVSCGIEESRALASRQTEVNPGALAQYETDQATIANLRKQVSDLTAEKRGELWYWQPGEDNDIDSLSCPVLIPADALRDLLASRQSCGVTKEMWDKIEYSVWVHAGDSRRTNLIMSELRALLSTAPTGEREWISVEGADVDDGTECWIRWIAPDGSEKFDLFLRERNRGLQFPYIVGATHYCIVDPRTPPPFTPNED